MLFYLRYLVVLLGLGGIETSSALPLEFAPGTILQDAEIQEILGEFASPLLKAADLNPKDINLYLVASREINAFATLGDMIFLNTGLILFAQEPEVLVAVLSHEIGHLAGRHIVRTLDVLMKARQMGLVTAALGAVVGGVAGRPDAAMMGVMAGMQMGERSFLTYSRGQESAADQAGFRFLKQVGWPLSGFQTLFNKFKASEFSEIQQYLYTRTHPLNEDRIKAVSSALLHDKSKGMPSGLIERFSWLQHKIRAYMLPPSSTLEGLTPVTREGRYARAIALYRSSRFSEALEESQRVLADLKPGVLYNPRPYIHELRAQIFLEMGQVQKAIAEIEKTLQERPKSPLLRMLAAQIFITSKKPDLTQRGVEMLEKLAPKDKEDPFVWRLLSMAYGQQNRMGYMALALAEMGLRKGDKPYAIQQAKRAQGLLKKGNPAFQRSQDILLEARQE